MSGDVCDEGVLHSSMFKPAAFLSKLASVKMCKHLRGVNAFVFFLMCSLKANPSCVPLGEMLDIDDLDPARLPQRKSMNDYVDLVSRSHEADDVWVGHNEAQDRTMSAMGKILLGDETDHKESELDKLKRTGHVGACQQSCRNGNKNSNSNDVVNEVFLRRVNVPAVPLLKTSYLQLESYFKRSDVQFCQRMCQSCSRSNAEGNGHLQISLVFLLVKCDCLDQVFAGCLWSARKPFWTLIVILTRSKRTPTHSGSRRRSSEIRFGLR